MSIKFGFVHQIRFQNSERQCDQSPVDFSKPWYVRFQHLRKHFHVKVLFHTLLGAEVLQNSGDVRQKDIIQRAALNGINNIAQHSRLQECKRLLPGLPQICIRDVTLNKFIQCIVDDLVDVHCLLLRRRTGMSLCTAVNNQTAQLSPMHQLQNGRKVTRMLQKYVLMKAWL